MRLGALAGDRGLIPVTEPAKTSSQMKGGREVNAGGKGRRGRASMAEISRSIDRLHVVGMINPSPGGAEGNYHSRKYI